MKKKLLALFMGMTLTVGTAACGSSSAPQSAQPDQSQQSNGDTAAEAQATDSESQGKSASDEADKDMAVENVDGEKSENDASSGDEPEFLSRSSYYIESDDTGKFNEPISRGNIETLKLTDESAARYPEFAKALESYMAIREDNAKTDYEQYTSDNKEYRASIDKRERPYIRGFCL